MTRDLDRYAPAGIERFDAASGIQELEERFAMAVRQRELLEKYIKDRFHPDKHFYKMRDSDKPSLTKEGAELVCLAHAYKPEYEKVAGPDQPPENDAPYQITVKCRLFTSRGPAGEGLGSASSHITLSAAKGGGRVPRQTDPGLRHNATLKMAQKSAYIAVTLNSTAASEFFTQDMEDAEGTAGEGEGTNQSAHYCEEHKTNWFKSPKMRNYAHPVEGGPWCNEPAQEARTAPPAPATAPTPAQPAAAPQGQRGPRPAGFCEGHRADMFTSRGTKKVGHVLADGSPCLGIPAAEKPGAYQPAGDSQGNEPQGDDGAPSQQDDASLADLPSHTDEVAALQAEVADKLKAKGLDDPWDYFVRTILRVKSWEDYVHLGGTVAMARGKL